MDKEHENLSKNTKRNNSKRIDLISKTMIFLFALFSIILGISFIYLYNTNDGGLILNYFKAYIFVLWMPLIFGGVLTIFGLIILIIAEKSLSRPGIKVSLKYKSKLISLGEFLIFIGAIIGITNLLSLIGLKLHYLYKDKLKRDEATIVTMAETLNERSSDVPLENIKDATPKKTQSFSFLLFFPILFAYLSFAIFISLIQDRTHIPLVWWGRNGLTLFETIWDSDAFWGEFYSNIMMIAVASIFILLKFNPKYFLNNIDFMDAERPRILLKKFKEYALISFTITIGLIILMLIFKDPQYSIIEDTFKHNWFSTQFAYRVIYWPAILTGFALFIFTLDLNRSNLYIFEKLKKDNKIDNSKSKSRDNTNSKRFSMEIMVLLLIFLAIWLYLTAISEFHPHVVLNTQMGFYFFAYSMFMLIPLSIFIMVKLFGRILSDPHDKNLNKIEKDDISIYINMSNNSTHKATRTKNIFLFLALWLSSLLFIVGLQIYAAHMVPLETDTSIFSITLDWWWPLTHWTQWLFILSSICGIVFGTFYFHLKRIIIRDFVDISGENQDLKEQKQKQKQKQDLGAQRSEMNNGHKRERSKKISQGAIEKYKLILKVFAIILIIVAPSFSFVKAELYIKDLNKPLLLVNQVGYYNNAPKRVIFQTYNCDYEILPENVSFEILDNNNSVVFQGHLNKSVQRYGHAYMVGDFSHFNRTGKYRIRANILGRQYTSYDFEIGPDVYKKAAELTYLFFYYQRCGYEVKEIVPGYKGHHACHLDDAEVWNGTDWVYKDLTGGWHDAGDYNKYNSWFQTQWYCVQALAEASNLDPDNYYSSFPNLYDTSLPDIFDEALWGAKFLINSINVEGYQGEDKKYLIWENVLGYRHDSEQEARMSYWGPPEHDWTAPRRVGINRYNTTFCGYHRGYDIAAALLQVARMIDKYTLKYPNVELPNWITHNTSYIRDLANHLYNKYLEMQNDTADDLQSLIGKFLYQQELGILNGNNWTALDQIITKIIPLVNDLESWPLWFGWAGYYALGNILMHYLNFNRTIPQFVLDKIKTVQNENFKELFPEPFKIKHVMYNGTSVLFYGAERQTDILTSAWLESLILRINSTLGDPEIVQAIFDWIFGVNPGGVCMLEGVGDYTRPQYHQRYSYARNPSGATPGALPNGLSLEHVSKNYMAELGLDYTDENILTHFGDMGWFASWPGNPLMRDGVPSNPNEVWIPHNAMFLKIFTTFALYNPFLF
ncbi:MAG: glycoside hydrolase family 9 protein [Promethearchaeota archaeon]